MSEVHPDYRGALCAQEDICAKCYDQLWPAGGAHDALQPRRLVRCCLPRSTSQCIAFVDMVQRRPREQLSGHASSWTLSAEQEQEHQHDMQSAARCASVLARNDVIDHLMAPSCLCASCASAGAHIPPAYIPQAEDDFGLLSTRGIRPPKLRADAAAPPALEPREGDVAVNSFYGSRSGYAPGSALGSGSASGGSRVYALRPDAGAGGPRGSGGAREASPAQVHPAPPAASACRACARMVCRDCRRQHGALVAQGLNWRSNAAHMQTKDFARCKAGRM